MFWSAFQGLQLDINNIGAFQGSLIGLSGEQVQVKGHITLKTIFDSRVGAIIIKVKYLVVDDASSYNVILGRPYLNLLGCGLVHPSFMPQISTT